MTVANTEAIADAIDRLKRRWNARRVVVAGHSGGAVLAANVLGRHPTLIEKALLVSVVHDVEEWRQHMFEQTGAPVFQGDVESLSPIDQISGLSDRVEVTVVVGSRDEVAPPSFSERYEAVAREHGKKVRLLRLEGAGHDILLDPAVLQELRRMLA